MRSRAADMLKERVAGGKWCVLTEPPSVSALLLTLLLIFLCPMPGLWLWLALWDTWAVWRLAAACAGGQKVVERTEPWAEGRGHCLSGQALCLWGRRQLATQGSAIANIASTVSENGAPRSQPTSRTALDTAVLYRLLLPLPICNLSSRASGGARSGIGHELGSIRPAGGMLVRKNDQESTCGSMLSSFKVVR